MTKLVVKAYQAYASREVLGTEAHFSKSLVLWGLSLSPLCLHLSPVSSPHVPACPIFLWPQPAPFARPPLSLCQASPLGSPITPSPCWFPMSACPVSMSKSLYFVEPDDTFVIIGREGFIDWRSLFFHVWVLFQIARMRVRFCPVTAKDRDDRVTLNASRGSFTFERFSNSLRESQAPPSLSFFSLSKTVRCVHWC